MTVCRGSSRGGSRGFVVERTSRDAPANAAVASRSASSLGPGSYNPACRLISSHVERAFGDWDATMPANVGFGLGERSDSTGSIKGASTGDRAADLYPVVTHQIGMGLPGGRFRVLPEQERYDGPLQPSGGTAENIGPGTYATHRSLHYMERHAPHASIVGRPRVETHASTLGPSTYEPYAPLGHAIPRETTPGGAGGLRYSFSASAFYSRSPSRAKLRVEEEVREEEEQEGSPAGAAAESPA